MLNRRKTIPVIRIMTFCAAFLLTASVFSVSAFAASYVNEDTGYSIVIEDDAGLLSSSEEEALAEVMYGVSEYGNAAFHSVDNGYFSTSSYAEEYYRENFGKDSGVVFLVDMVNRQLYIFADGVVYKTITEDKANTITDNVYRYASYGQYYECAEEAFKEMQSLLSGSVIAQPMKYICNAILSVLAAMLILFIAVSRVSRARRASVEKLVEGASAVVDAGSPSVQLLSETRRYSPVSKGSGGGGGGGGGFGGGSSGGGGGHGF